MIAENCREKEKYKSDYRLIEAAFPVDAVSKAGSHERYLQGCTPHSLHVWWARRPFSAMRAIVFSSLAPAPSQQAALADLLTLTDEISASADAPPLFMNAARDIILQSHGGRPPLVLDMFGGGGQLRWRRHGSDVELSALTSIHWPISYSAPCFNIHKHIHLLWN
jgi:adenine-specific DNA methylase